MRESKDDLARLLRAAALAPQQLSQLSEEAPVVVEQRVLAHWRRFARHDESDALLRVFRWAFVCATLAIFLSVFFNYRSLSQATPNEFNIADSVIKLSLLP